jgi:glycosyltransferase domain-containing protein
VNNDKPQSCSELTLILVLKDRKEFTTRWLEYYSLFQSHINVIIADGSENRFFTVAEIQQLPSNIRYFYDGPDTDIQAMIQKIQKSISMVESDFTILASNDDFYLLSGLAEAVEFLTENDEWQASAGVVRDFSILNFPKPSDDTYGKVRFGDVLYKSSSIGEASSIERVGQFLSTNESFWHAVYRTRTLHWIYSEAVKMQIKDLVIYELFINLKSAQIGKLHRNRESLFMLHQVHSQMEAYKLKNLEARDQKWKEELNSLLECLFQSIDSNQVAPTYEDIFKIRQKAAVQPAHFRLRPAIERFKFKFAKSKLISVLNLLDPFTASVYRNQEVRVILEFLKKPI